MIAASLFGRRPINAEPAAGRDAGPPGAFDRPNMAEPVLDPDERDLFRRVLAARWSRYHEFGVGGSTVAAVRSGVAELVAVESDPRWAEAANAHPEVAERVRGGSASVIHADVGPVGEWGHPSDTASSALWPDYVGLAWREWARRGSFPQLVYVDGRFRVACCLSAILACSGPDSGPDASRRLPVVMMRTLSDQRPYYAPILEFFEPITAAGSLHLLRWRAGASRAAAFNAFLAHQLDPR